MHVSLTLKQQAFLPGMDNTPISVLFTEYILVTPLLYNVTISMKEEIRNFVKRFFFVCARSAEFFCRHKSS